MSALILNYLFRLTDVLQMDKLGIVPEPIVKSAHEGESVEDPKDNISIDPGELPMSTVSRVTDIRAATMMFEASHGECIRVLPYIRDGQIVVQFYVYSGESGIPKDLKEEAQTFFEDMNVKLEWSDLYNNSVNILKVQRLEHLFGKPKTLTASQVEEMNDVIEKNLPILSKHRNVTSVQASFKIKNCTQKDEPCITIYVLGKGFIPFGELAFPNAFEGYPVDVVNGFWIRAGKQPIEAQEPSDVLCLGASIGVQGKEASGTLGAIVKDGSTYYALSCDHVMNSEESNCIVHPGLNDHLYYLKYYLAEYKRCVDDVTGSEIECSVETLSSSEALGNKFEELKRIKDNHPERSKYTSADLERIEKLEKAFEKGNKPPRKIGEYFAGVNKNVLWPQTNGKEYFIDAAIAKLSDEEVTRLKQSRTARLIGNPIKIRGECEPNHIPAISETSKLCKSGRTTGITEIGNKIVGIGVVAPHFMKPPLYELHDPFVSCEAKTFVCESCGESQSIVAESEQPRSCEECGQGKAAMNDKFWLKRCLCIQEGEEEFAKSGDSGSVIFVKVKKDDPEKTAECDPEKKAGCDRKKKAEYVLDGVGLLFGIQNHQYCRYIFASPLKIALAALTEEHRDISSLALVASYQ